MRCQLAMALFILATLPCSWLVAALGNPFAHSVSHLLLLKSQIRQNRSPQGCPHLLFYMTKCSLQLYEVKDHEMGRFSQIIQSCGSSRAGNISGGLCRHLSVSEGSEVILFLWVFSLQRRISGAQSSQSHDPIAVSSYVHTHVYFLMILFLQRTENNPTSRTTTAVFILGLSSFPFYQCYMK